MNGLSAEDRSEIVCNIAGDYDSDIFVAVEHLITRAVTAERNRLADEIEAEHLTDATGLSEDIAYDLAIEHAAAIVRPTT